MDDSDVESDYFVQEDAGQAPLNNFLNVDDSLDNGPNLSAVINAPDSPKVPQLPGNQNMCMTCLVVSATDSAEQYIVLLCGHAWVCGTCVRQLEQICLMCRAQNITYHRVYFS